MLSSATCLKPEISKEGQEIVLRINAEQCPFFPSIEDEELCMSVVIDNLIENPSVTTVVFNQKRDYEYDARQVSMLHEIAKIQRNLKKESNALLSHLSREHGGGTRIGQRLLYELRNIMIHKLKRDPIGTFVQLKRTLRVEEIGIEQAGDRRLIRMHEQNSEILEHLIGLLEDTRLIQQAKPYLAGYHQGDRSPYRALFNPYIRPDFMFTRIMATVPTDSEEIDSYHVGDNYVSIFQKHDSTRPLYHITPPEFLLSEEKYELLDVARSIIAEHKPERSEFVDPTRTRQIFTNVGSDLLEELSSTMKITLRQKEIDKLTKILVRYTIGFGLVEVLLQDKNVQDITINSPMGNLPMFIVHQKYDDCSTNIIPTERDAQSWATKLRFASGRPLDEANPVLDTELIVPEARARVAVIGPPLNSSGLAYAFRRHRDKPWTLPLFIKNRMLTPLAAGVLSFLIDGARTFLVAGTRSAGKTSLLGAMMTEILRKHRIISIEDTLELPIASMKELKYNIQSMKVASAITSGTTEVHADEGIRTTLRMGDSCLIIGEVRSTEAKALYEAMRIGALANVVAGTIHGDSPYGVYDRIVNDLEVPKTSFKATDVILVANPVRSADYLNKQRRITQITEVTKEWEEDPLLEQGFRDLLTYNATTDKLEPSSELTNGDSQVIKNVAKNVKEWAGSWDAVWENIQLRAMIKEKTVQMADKAQAPWMLEAEFVVAGNEEFHKIASKINNEVGGYDNKRILREWESWLKLTFRENNAKQNNK